MTGLIPLFVSEFIKIAKLLNPCPVVKNDIKKSSIDNVKLQGVDNGHKQCLSPVIFWH